MRAARPPICAKGAISMTDENRSLKDKIRDFLEEKGVYVVLLSSVAIVGIAAAAAYWPKQQPQPSIEPSPAPVSQNEDQTLSEALLSTPVPTPTASPSALPDITPDPSPGPSATHAPAYDKAPAPLKGKVQWRFAVDELIYSRTLDHWTTHRGIDISCAKGAEVHCPWNGKVEEIYEDDSLGITVRVSHSDGLESLYSNLRTGCPVKAGQRLNAGDLIGYVGETAVAECGDGAHLHFEVRKDGRSVDPAEYVTVTE